VGAVSVVLYCLSSACPLADATRVRYEVAEDGSKTRVASGSGQALDKE